MDRLRLFEWVREQYGVEPEYPWGDNNAVLRRADNAKWFGAVLEVRRDRLGLKGTETVDVLNVKCDPLCIGSLRLKPGCFPAYHMNKDHWITLLLDGSVPEDDIFELTSLSYALTAPKKRKKIQKENER